MSALLREAWKADLNFIPSKPDYLQPHQIIEEEMKQYAYHLSLLIFVSLSSDFVLSLN